MIIRRAPSAVEIAHGEFWPIRTDFRYWVQFERLLLDNSILEEDKAMAMLELAFPWMPDDGKIAAEKIVWFWQCGIERSGSGEGTSRQIYDYELDATYLYAAFMADYNIDIESVQHLHWWKFRSLMMNLKSDNLFCRILDWRGADITKKKGDERKLYEQMRRYYALPTSADEKEKKKIIMDALRGDGDVQGALQKAGLS